MEKTQNTNFEMKRNKVTLYVRKGEKKLSQKCTLLQGFITDAIGSQSATALLIISASF